MDGLVLMRQAGSALSDLEMLVVTACGDIPLAVDAIRQEAYDFLAKPFERAELERAAARAPGKQALAAENRRLRLARVHRRGVPASQIAGRSPAIRRLLQLAEQVAPSSGTVLVTGEGGTGEEVVAGSGTSSTRSRSGGIEIVITAVGRGVPLAARARACGPPATPVSCRRSHHADP